MGLLPGFVLKRVNAAEYDLAGAGCSTDMVCVVKVEVVVVVEGREREIRL